jgi:hypothetical protein
MANWITIFVQVPLITFNPVKSVNDLLQQRISRNNGKRKNQLSFKSRP